MYTGVTGLNTILLSQNLALSSTVLCQDEHRSGLCLDLVHKYFEINSPESNWVLSWTAQNQADRSTNHTKNVLLIFFIVDDLNKSVSEITVFRFECIRCDFYFFTKFSLKFLQGSK